MGFEVLPSWLSAMLRIKHLPTNVDHELLPLAQALEEASLVKAPGALREALDSMRTF